MSSVKDMLKLFEMSERLDYLSSSTKDLEKKFSELFEKYIDQGDAIKQLEEDFSKQRKIISEMKKELQELNRERRCRVPYEK